jgi:metal-responsive CopG/Arc/MetJ family transcriptional regulator
MTSFSVKVPESIKRRISADSKELGISQSELIRRALQEYFDKEKPEMQGSFYELAKDLASSVEGSSDLSFNKEHLNDYGE